MTDQAAAASAVPTGRFLVRAVLRTDVGLVRSENQDFGTLTTTAEERRSSLHVRLLIVADGMGGHRGGATASRLAGETVKAQFLQNTTKDIPGALRESLSRANARIFSESQTNPDLRGMGTTTSALAIQGNQGWFAHVGDSRIYMVRAGEIKQLTDDHSLVATMVREGLLTSKEAETHPRRNVLQRSMGVAEDVEIDVRGPFEVKEGDTFILCSDGLHGLVKEDELKEIAARSVVDAADQFVKLALERGAPDNVTVIVARIEKQGEGAEEIVHEEDDEDPVDSAMFDETMREPGEAAAASELLVDPSASTLPQTAAVPPTANFTMDEVMASSAVTSEVPVPAGTPTAPGTLPRPGAPHSSDPSVPPYVPFDAPVRTKPTTPTTAYAMAAAAAGSEAEDATLRVAPSAATAKGGGDQGDDTAKVRKRADGQAAVAEPRGNPLLKWMLIAVVILGAAGALLFMNRAQDKNPPPPSQTTPSR